MLDAFLVSWWAGSAVAIVLLAIAAALAVSGFRIVSRWRRWPLFALAGLVCLLGVFAGWGALSHLAEARRMAKLHPPPGRMIDVGGYRLHLWCEGPRNGPTVLWIPGTHSQGLWLLPLHRLARVERRSCLYDRAGAGWSDVGPLPKTPTVEVREIEAALHGAGEDGPFVVAAHSMGGSLGVTFAARRPDLVRGVVLIDALSPRAFAFDRDRRCPALRGQSRLGALAAQFGLAWAVARAKPDAAHRVTYSRLGPATVEALVTNDALPRSTLMLGEVYWQACTHPTQMASIAGALGDIPLIAIEPQASGLKSRAAEMRAQGRTQGLDPFELAQVDRLFRTMQDENARLSTRGRKVMGPAGTTHQIPFEAPEFVLEQVRAVAADVTTGTAP